MKKTNLFFSLSTKQLNIQHLPKKKHRSILAACLMVLLILLISPSSLAPLEQQKLQIKSSIAPQKKTITRDFNLVGLNREVIDFEVTAPGPIEAKATWRGKATTLALILNGPGQTGYYERKDGQSPLSLTFNVTNRHLSLGKMWKISVANFSSTAEAQGRVQISYPEKREISPPVAPIEKKPITPVKPVTPVAPEEAKEKSINIKHYEIVEAEGFTAQQLKEIKAKLEEQRIEQTKAKMEKRITEITQRNPLANVVIPLIYQKMEEKSQRRMMVRRVDISPRFQTMVQSYNAVSPSIKSQSFHPSYAQLKPGQRINKLQLGKDLLSAVRPNYKNEIRQMVRKSLSPQAPKFQWKAAAVQRVEIQKVKKIGMKPSQLQLSQLDTLTGKLRLSPTHDNLKELRNFAQAQGFSVADVSYNQVHQAIADKLRAVPNWIPDLNSDHFVRNYYKYEIGLDWFYCVDQNERTCVWIPFVGTVCSDDEPYWHIASVVPRYDPNDPDQMHRLHRGDLYTVSSRVTGTYDDVNNRESRVFRSQDRPVINSTTYNAQTTFAIDLWEEDWSKADVREALQEAAQDLRNDLTATIQEAVLEAMKEAFYESLKENLPPQLQQKLRDFFEGRINFEALMSSVQNSLGEVDMSWIILEWLFAGKSLAQIIVGLSGTCPPLATVLAGLEVVGPIIVDLLQGDFNDVFKGILMLPVTLVKYIVELFTDIIGFFWDLMAIVDPDDHIQTRSIIIKSSTDNAILDARWGDNYSPAGSGGTPSGCGPKSSNSSFIMGGRYVQPYLSFEGADAKYSVYYNVRRILVGGRETFGYTSKVYPDPTWNLADRTYKVKTRSRNKQIKVSYCVMNANGNPLIVLSEKRGRASGSNLGASERVFYVDAIPGGEYEMRITNLFGRGDLYGYITLEEK